MSTFRSFAFVALSILSLTTPSLQHALHKRQGPLISGCSGGRVAITYDDGPAQYTNVVLDKLAASGHRATFFLNGQNYGNIYSYTGEVQRMIRDGHQVASHTWSHPHLPQLNDGQINSEVIQLEQALSTIIGKYSTYIRPPYLETDGRVESILYGLGYKLIGRDLETDDWRYQDQGQIEQAARNFENGLNQGQSISLAHDPNYWTATYLTDRMIQILNARGIKSVPVGECIGDPASNWYSTARGGGTPPPPPPTGGTSPDGTCGGANGYTCQSGLCCSQYGWCDVGSAYCGAGCQPAFGLCGI